MDMRILLITIPFANGLMRRIRISMFTFYGFIDIFFKNYIFFTTIMWVIIKINEHGTKSLYQLTFFFLLCKKCFFPNDVVPKPNVEKKYSINVVMNILHTPNPFEPVIFFCLRPSQMHVIPLVFSFFLTCHPIVFLYNLHISYAYLKCHDY